MSAVLAMCALVWPGALLLVLAGLAERVPAIGRFLDRLL